MHAHAIAVLALQACLFPAVNAHWWWKTKTVTCTVTETQAIHTCTTKCSSFGTLSCTSTGPPTSKQASTSTTSSRLASSTKTPSLTSTKQTSGSPPNPSQPPSSRSKTASNSPVSSSKSPSSTIPPTATTKSTSSASKTSSSTSSVSLISKPSTVSTSSSSTASGAGSAPSLISSLLVKQSTSTTTQSTQSAHPSQSPSASTSAPTNPQQATGFLLRARSPLQPEADGQYAVVSDKGRVDFAASSPETASRFTLSSSGQLIYSDIPAFITPSDGVSRVQFISLQKRQAGTTPVTCITTADTNGAALVQCSANTADLQQTCGTGFYLGATQQCQPLILAQIPPGSAAATTNTPTPVNPAPSAQFSLQANGPPLNLDSKADFGLYYNNDGLTKIAFSKYFNGPPFSLDANGHFVGIGPTQDGQSVAYAATFAIGSTFGPVAMMYGQIADRYAPIVCRIPPGFDAGDGPVYALQCKDGATGGTTVLQTCAGNVLSLGTSVGMGCKVPVFRVFYTGS